MKSLSQHITEALVTEAKVDLSKPGFQLEMQVAMYNRLMKPTDIRKKLKVSYIDTYSDGTVSKNKIQQEFYVTQNISNVMKLFTVILSSHHQENWFFSDEDGCFCIERTGKRYAMPDAIREKYKIHL